MGKNGTSEWQATPAGQALQERLTNEQTLMALTRLLDKVESLEQSVNALTQAPAMLAMVADMADETVGNAAARGVDVEARLQAGLSMAEKLTAPETMAKFDKLLDLADQAPGMVAMFSDMADETVANAAARGVDVEGRLKAGLAMAEKLTAPDMIAKFDQLIAIADQAPGMFAMFSDMADEAVGNAAARGVDVESRLMAGLAMAEKLTAPDKVAKFDQLLEMADQAPKMLAMFGDMADEAVGNAAARGVDVEARLMAGLAMAEKLTAPDKVAKFDQLLEMADQAPKMLAMFGDMADEAVGNAAARGVDVEARLKAGLAMAEKLTAPEMIAKFDQLIAISDQAPGFVAMVGDVVDDTVFSMSTSGVDIGERIQIALQAAERLTSPAMGKALPILTDSQLVDMLGLTGEAFKESMTMPPSKINLRSLFGALKDPDIQRGLNLLLNFGRAFGRKLS